MPGPAGLPPPLPRPSTAMSATSDGDVEEGPLWESMKRQLYKAEVSHVRRLVGEALIQQTKLLWAEFASLRQIVAEYEQQGDEIAQGKKQQVQFCSSQHRDLLRRQARIVLDDARAQAEACGHVLEDLVPEVRDPALREYLLSSDDEPRPRTTSRPPTEHRGSFSGMRRVTQTPPVTPSTRPPSSCGGVSLCSSPEVGFVALPLGRQLAVDELDGVADGIREALQSEQESLLVAICEQTQRFEAEAARRSAKATACREPSTAELQRLVHKLQELIMSPSLRTLALTGPPSPKGDDGPSAASPWAPTALRPISGGSNVRRLKALIAERRRCTDRLGAVDESSAMAAKLGLGGGEVGDISVARVAGGAGKPGFDPFFDDPFA